jgi:hypothetical protein
MKRPGVIDRRQNPYDPVTMHAGSHCKREPATGRSDPCATLLPRARIISWDYRNLSDSLQWLFPDALTGLLPLSCSTAE